MNSDTVLLEVLASFAADRMGIEHEPIRRQLHEAVVQCSLRDLIYFDPAVEAVPDDVPEDCPCGHVNERGRTQCKRCAKSLRPRSRYEIWYYALTNTYFCEQHGIPLGARYADVLKQLPQLKPYPAPGAPHYYSSIYAVTHTVYTLNGYGRSRLSPRLLPEEFSFLKASMAWALEQEEADTIGEITDSLVAFGLSDAHPLVVRGRRFLLDTQRDDGGWGDESGDDYGYFHTLWTAIDGLRNYKSHATPALGRLRSAITAVRARET